MMAFQRLMCKRNTQQRTAVPGSKLLPVPSTKMHKSIDHKSIDQIYDYKIIKVGQTCGYYPAEQNVICLFKVCQPQTLFRAIFQNPMEKLHCFFVEGTHAQLTSGFQDASLHHFILYSVQTVKSTETNVTFVILGYINKH